MCRTSFIDSIKNLNDEFKLNACLFDDFISQEFSKTVSIDQDYLYKLSAAYSKYIFNRGFDCILYSSVASNGACGNVAIRKEAIDNNILSPDIVLYGTIYGRESEVIQQYDMRSKKIITNGNIVWEELYGLEYKLHPKVKNYFLGRSDINYIANKIDYELLD